MITLKQLKEIYDVMESEFKRHYSSVDERLDKLEKHWEYEETLKSESEEDKQINKYLKRTDLLHEKPKDSELEYDKLVNANLNLQKEITRLKSENYISRDEMLTSCKQCFHKKHNITLGDELSMKEEIMLSMNEEILLRDKEIERLKTKIAELQNRGARWKRQYDTQKIVIEDLNRQKKDILEGKS